MYKHLHIKYILFLSDLTKLQFSRHVFEKYPYIKDHENMSGKSLVVPCGRADGRTDRHDEFNIFFSQFCESA